MRESSPRRDRFEIAADILDSVERGKNKKTHIMYRCNLSFRQINNYIGALVKAGYVTVDDGAYNVTPQGKVILQASREFKQKIEPIYRFLRE